MKRNLTALCFLTLESFGSGEIYPKAVPFVTGRVGVDYLTSLSFGIAGGVNWNIPVNNIVDVDLAVAGKLRAKLNFGYWPYSSYVSSSVLKVSGSLSIIPTFTTDINFKTSNPKIDVYIGLDLGVGLDMGNCFSFLYVGNKNGFGFGPTVTLTLQGGVKLKNRNIKIGGYIGLDGLGIEAGALF